MKFQFTATAKLSPESVATLAEWFAAGAETAESDMARGREQSRLSGMEVIYDLTQAGCDWSPVLWHASEKPIAWVHRDGRRSEGADHPGEDA